jgi:hypothetical protein
MTRSALLALLVASAGCKTSGSPTPEPPAKVVAAKLAPGATVQIDFAPPEAKTLTELWRVSRSEGPVGGATTHAETVSSTLEMRYERSGDGWTLMQRIPAVTISRDGKVWDDPLLQFATKFSVKSKMSAGGEFSALLNPDDARQAVRATFHKEVEQETLLQMFTDDAQEGNARRQWNSRFAGLFGRPLKAGTALYTVDAVGLTTGQVVQYVMERTVEGTTSTDYGEALVLAVKCLSKAEEAAERSELERVLKEAGDVTLEPSARCDGQQIFARAPFVPVRSWLKVHAVPEQKAGSPKLEVAQVQDIFASRLQ